MTTATTVALSPDVTDRAASGSSPRGRVRRPLYGPGTLALRPLTGDVVATMTGTVSEPVWYCLANLGTWTTVFILLCLAARRRSTVRR